MVKRILKARFMHLLSLLTGLLLAFFIIFLLVMHTDFFAQNTGRTVSRYLFSGTDFSLRIEGLSGNPLKGLEITGVTIRYEGKDFSFDVLRIDVVRIRYDLLALVSSEPVLGELVLVRPHIWIKPDSSGVNIIPGAGGAGFGKFPGFAVDRFSVEGGQIILQGSERADAFRSIDVVGSLRLLANEVSVNIEEGAGENISRALTLHRLSGNVSWISGGSNGTGPDRTRDRIMIEALRIELDESLLTLDGVVHPDSLDFMLRIDTEPAQVEEIARALGKETSHYGEIQGTFIMKGNPEIFTVTGRANGIFSGFALSDFSLDLEHNPSSIHMRRLRGTLNGAFVEGTGTYRFHGPPVLHVELGMSDLNLASGFVPGTRMPESRLSGVVSIAYFDSTGEADFTCELDRGHVFEFPFNEARIRGGYHADSLGFDHIWMSSPTHEITSSGYLKDNGDLKFFIDVTCGAADTLFPYFAIEDYRTGADLNAVVEGTLDAWSIRANGRVSDFEYKGTSVPGGDLKLAIIKNEDYDVYVDLAGDSVIIFGYRFSDFDLSLAHVDGVTGLKRVRFARPALRASIRGEITSDNGVTVVDLSEFSFESLEEYWQSSGKFRVVLGDSLVAFEDMQLHSREGAVYLDLLLHQGKRELEGELRFERAGLSLLNRAGLLDVPIDGKSWGRIEAGGRFDDPEVRLDLQLEQMRIDTIAVDTLIACVHYAKGAFSIDSLAAFSPFGDFVARGTITGVRLEDLHREVSAAARSAIIDLQLQCRKLELEPLFTRAESIPFSNGLFTGSVAFRDAFAHPSVTFTGEVSELEGPLFTVPSVVFSGAVGGAAVEIEGSVSLVGEMNGRFKGRFPLVWQEWFYALDRNRPMAFELYVPEAKLVDIPSITRLIAEGEGKFSVALSVTGSADDSSVLGQVTLDDASFRLAGMEERYYDVNAKILIEDTLLTVSRLEGKGGKDGRFRCGGTMALEGLKPAGYALTVDLDDFLVASIPDVMAIVSGRLEVGSSELEGRTIPELTGDLEVKRSEIFYDLGDFASAGETGTMAPPSWIAEIDLEVPGNSWIETPDARVELQGEITLHHDQRGTYLRGHLDLIRGHYTLYNNKFYVRSGKISFVHAGGYRPVVDIEAETKDPEGRKIFLNFSWHQDDVEPRLSLVHEDPGYSETDVWKMLGGGIVGSGQGEGSSWDAASTAQNLAANYIERMLNSQMQGVTVEFETVSSQDITDGQLKETETMIAVGKYMSEGLYVKYKQGISMTSAIHFEVEYRLKRWLLLRSQYSRYSGKLISGSSQGSTDEITFDVKLRWEY